MKDGKTELLDEKYCNTNDNSKEGKKVRIFKRLVRGRSGNKIIFEMPEEKKETKEIRTKPKMRSSGNLTSSITNFRVSPACFRVEKLGHFEDQYEALDLIGTGGFGEVKKLRNKITKELRAVKVMAKNKCQMTESFSDEINILQKLVLKKIYIGSSKCY